MENLNILFQEDFIEPESLDVLFPLATQQKRESLMALKTAMAVATPYQDMDVFENLAQVFNDQTPDVSKTEGCEPKYIFYALQKLERLTSPVPLSDEVKMYIKWNLTEAGIYFYPENAGFTQPDWYKDMVARTVKSAPLQVSDFLDVQTYKFLKIQEYIANAGNTL